MADAVLKTIKIKTGVVSRLTKEKLSYEKELVTEQKRIEDMKSAGKDAYDIRKQEEVLQETRDMIPHCSRRLRTAVEDLKSALTEGGIGDAGEEILKSAQDAISKAESEMASA